MPDPFIQGVVVENRHWTDQLYSLRIDADVKPFTPGQFGRVALDIGDKRVARPYSFVNAPGEAHHEFYSIIVPEGLLSLRLHALVPGDKVWVASSAAGFFTLDEVRAGNELWMLSTGTALGPFLSILKSDEVWRRFARIVLVHAVRRAEELTYRDVIAGFEKRDAERFVMVPFVSREACDFALGGRVPAAIESGALEERAATKFDAATSQVMICGNPGMVEDTSRVLKARGFKKNRRRDPGNITTENYW